MPRGKTLLPDGTEVSIRSKAYRDYLESQPEQAERLARTIPVGLTFEAPSEEDGEPGETQRPTPKRKAATTKTERHEDQLDFAALIGLTYAGIAGATHFEGWAISEEEALAIARPMQRILARHKHLDKAVRQFVDPIALVTAVGVATVPRYAAWTHHQQLQRIAPAQKAPLSPNTESQPQSMRPAPAPPTTIPKANSPTMERLSQGFL